MYSVSQCVLFFIIFRYVVFVCDNVSNGYACVRTHVSETSTTIGVREADARNHGARSVGDDVLWGTGEPTKLNCCHSVSNSVGLEW